jgi:hypothetical protein
MGHYESDYENASADLVEYYSQPISYLDDSLDEPIQLCAQVHPERTERRKNDFGWYLTQTRMVKFLDDDFKAEIRTDGHFFIGVDHANDDLGYAVESVMSLPGRRTQVNLTRATAGEVGRRDYRR